MRTCAALRVALTMGGGGGGGGFSSVVLVHSARSKRDLALLDQIHATVASTAAGSVATSVHIAITNRDEGGDELDIPLLGFTESRGRVTEGGFLAGVWQGRRKGTCVVSGPQGMLDDVRRVALEELGFASDKCHVLEA